jgi:phage-related protein
MAAIQAGIHTDQMKLHSEASFIAQRETAIREEQIQRLGILKELAATTDPAKKHALELQLGVVNHAIAMNEQSVRQAELQRAKTVAHLAELKKEAIEQAREMKMGWQGHVGEMIGNVLGSIGTFIGNFLGSVGGLKDKAIQKMKDLATGIINALLGLPGQMADLGGKIMQGLLDGAKKIPVVGGIVSAASGIIGGVASFFHIGSPSRKMADEIGKPIMEGWALGISEHASKVHGAMRDVANGVMGVGTGAVRGSLALSGASVGGAGGGSGSPIIINISMDASAGLHDAQTRKVIARNISREVANEMSRLANHQRISGAGYTGNF